MTPTEEARVIAVWPQGLSHAAMVQPRNIIDQRDESDPETPRIREDTRTVVTLEARAADAQIVGAARGSPGWDRDWRESPARRLPLGDRRAGCDGAAVADGQRGARP